MYNKILTFPADLFFFQKSEKNSGGLSAIEIIGIFCSEALDFI